MRTYQERTERAEGSRNGHDTLLLSMRSGTLYVWCDRRRVGYAAAGKGGCAAVPAEEIFYGRKSSARLPR